MDGENNGKPLLKWMIWGGKNHPYFWFNTHIWNPGFKTLRAKKKKNRLTERENLRDFLYGLVWDPIFCRCFWLRRLVMIPGFERYPP